MKWEFEVFDTEWMIELTFGYQQILVLIVLILIYRAIGYLEQMKEQEDEEGLILLKMQEFKNKIPLEDHLIDNQ